MVWHDLAGYIQMYLDLADSAGEDEGPALFRSTLGEMKRLTDWPLTTMDSVPENQVAVQGFRAAGAALNVLVPGGGHYRSAQAWHAAG